MTETAKTTVQTIAIVVIAVCIVIALFKGWGGA